MLHQRLRAMVPGADRDPAFIQDSADVVRMNPRHRKTDDTGAVFGAEQSDAVLARQRLAQRADQRSEEHTSELQSLMRNSYAVFCLKKKTHTRHNRNNTNQQNSPNSLTHLPHTRL